MKASEKNLKEGKPFQKTVIKPHKSEELQTDAPLSEKDEIKKAEEKLRSLQKKYPL